MVNSEFKVPEATSQSTEGVYMFNGGLTGSTLRIENNVFYVDKADVVALKFKLTTQTTAVDDLILKNNTFINMSNNAGNIGYFTNKVTFKSIDVQNNLFYVPLMTVNHYVFVEGGNFGSGVTANNAYYKGDNEKTFRMFNGSSNTPSFASTDLTKLTESPFSSMDHTNGVFVKTSAAAAYGATR